MVRCRPFNEKERQNGCQACVNIDTVQRQVELLRSEGTDGASAA
jgi:hypothetical protein